MNDLRSLTSLLPLASWLEAIFLRPYRHAPVQSVQSVLALAGRECRLLEIALQRARH